MIAKAVANVGFLVVLARILPKDDFGSFTYTFALGTILGLIVDYGFNIKFLRDLVRTGSDASESISAAITVKVALSGMLIGCVLLLGLWPNLSRVQFHTLLALTVANVLNSFGTLLLTPFKCDHRFDVEAHYVLIDSVALLTVGTAVALLTRDAAIVGISYCSAKAVFFALTLRRYLASYRLVRATRLAIGREARDGLPFALHLLVGGVYLNIDTVILKEFVSLAEVALYQAGMRIVVGAGLVLTVVNSVLTPRLAELTASDPHRLHFETRRCILILGAIGIIAIAFTSILSPLTVRILYGSQYRDLNELLWIFGIIIFLRCTGAVYGVLLTLKDKQQIRAISVLLTLVFIVVCDVYLLPTYGLRGAAFVLLSAHVILNAIYVAFVWMDYGSLFLWRRSYAPGPGVPV